MSASLTGTAVNQTLGVATIAAWFAGVPPEVALGSLAGAVIFVTSAVEYSIKRRLLLSLLSFLCGLLLFKPIASVLIGLASVIPAISFERGSVDAAGAFVAAIIAVRIGERIYRRSDNPGNLISGVNDDDKS